MKSSDKDFFKKIREAIFANPFSENREAVDLELSGLTRKRSNEEILSKLLQKTSKTISRYSKAAAPGNSALPSEERTLLQYGVLFHVFHQFCDDYDAHISEQIQAGEQPCTVSFADEALQTLSNYNFTHKEALRYFSLFFQLRRAFYFISSISGKSDSVRKLRQTLWNNIFTHDVGLYNEHLWNRMEDFSTILLGETGCGKGMAAMAIGRSGFIPFNPKTGCFNDSFARIFIPINLSQFSEQLIESELFGHKKGAFTGAMDNHKGVFSRCSSHGAIFLDEIGEVSIPVQIKLLQVLQERNFTPVGGHSQEKFKGRVIAATNQPLQQLRAKGVFRDDFYYRLCSDTIEVPSLRQRVQEHPEELNEIISITLKRIVGHDATTLTEEVSDLIHQSIPPDYGWPGNIRELEQCVRQMLLNRTYNWQPSSQKEEQLSNFQQQLFKGQLKARDLLSWYCTHLYNRYGTLEQVASQVALDRRTVKKYIQHTMDIKRDT